MRAFFVALIAATLAACGAPEQQPAPTAVPESSRTSGITVRDAWAAATPNGVDVSAGYLVVANGASADDRLLSATSPRAARVEVHEMTMDGAVMRMRPVEGLVVPSGGVAVLAPGAQHLMFYGVSQPFAEGENIPVVLIFEHAGRIEAALPVRRTALQDGH